MPWNGKSFHKHNKKLSPAQSAKAAKQANAILKETGDEGMAIAVANKNADKHKKTSTSKKMYKGTAKS